MPELGDGGGAADRHPENHRDKQGVNVDLALASHHTESPGALSKALIVVEGGAED